VRWFYCNWSGCWQTCRSSSITFFNSFVKKKFPKFPVVAAGGITEESAILSLEIVGAVGVSIGTRFIASTEASVNDAYKRWNYKFWC